MPGGRPPKPTADHKRDGTYQKCRHEDRADESLAIGKPQKPDFADDRASKLWDLIVIGLPEKAQATLDTPLLIGLCRWWCRWLDFMQKMDDTESDVEHYKLMVMAAAAWKQFATLASRFGMSPVDRARLKIGGGKAEPDDPLVRMLKARAGQN